MTIEKPNNQTENEISKTENARAQEMFEFLINNNPISIYGKTLGIMIETILVTFKPELQEHLPKKQEVAS